MYPVMFNALKVVAKVAIGTVGGLLMAAGMEHAEMKYLEYKNRKKDIES